MNLATPGAIALLNGTALPATLYAQMHTANPGTNGTSSVATLSTRKSFTRATAATPSTTNDSLLQWLSAPANETLTHISLWSAVSGGTCWMVGAVDGGGAAAITGQNVEVQIGSLVTTLTVWA